jgi:hypothetical protein
MNHTSGMNHFLLISPPGVFHPQVVEAADGVEDQVAGEHQHVPAQHRVREVVDADERDHVPEAVRPAHVGEDEHRHHDHGGDGQHLAQHGHLVHALVVVGIGREDDGHRPGGDADEEDQVGEVEAVVDLAGHAGDDQAVGVLQVEHVQHGEDEHAEGAHPGVELGAALEDVAHIVGSETGQLLHGSLLNRRSRRISGRC